MTRKTEIIDAARQALELRRDGASYRDIADRLDVSISTAHKYVQRELSDIPAAERVQLRELEAARLDALQALAWPLARTGDLAAIRECRAISESRRRLFGLDAPQQVEMRGVESVDIAGTARNILAQITGDDRGAAFEMQPFDETEGTDDER